MRWKYFPMVLPLLVMCGGRSRSGPFGDEAGEGETSAAATATGNFGASTASSGSSTTSGTPTPSGVSGTSPGTAVGMGGTAGSDGMGGGAGGMSGGAGEGAGGLPAFDGPLPRCTAENRGGCEPDDALALGAVRFRLVDPATPEVASGSSFVVELQVDVEPGALGVPGDRIGLVAPFDSGVRIDARTPGFDGGPCHAIGDFGLHGPARALFDVSLSGVAPGSTIEFYAWATGWHTDCASELFGFQLQVQ